MDAEVNRSLPEGVIPTETEAGDNLLAFKTYLTAKIPEEKLNLLQDFFIEQVSKAQESLSQADTEMLQATGEYPIYSPYDAIQGKPDLLTPTEVANYLIRRHFDILLLTHPARIAAIKNMENEKFQPVSKKNIKILDRLISKKHAVTFKDFAFNVEEPQDTVSLSAQEILAKGLFSWTTTEMVTIPYILSSMPDLSGPHALSTIALAQGYGFIPVDGIWSNLEKQVLLARRTFELLENDPVLNNHPDRKFILARAKKLIGGTLKANPEDAKVRVRRLWAEGIRSFRIYDPRSLGRLEETVDTVRQLIGSEGIIFAGQVVGINQAARLYKNGANALIVGIGEGGICRTPTEASIVVNNLLNGYKIIKSQVPIPLLFDSGIGRRTPVAIALGAAGVLKSQSIGNGIEKPPFMWWFRKENGLASLYSGEAASRTKWLGGKTDYLGRPLFVEGDDEFVILNPASPSIATNIYLLHQSLATSILFQHHKSLSDLQHTPNPELWTQSDNANHNSSSHHNSNSW